MANEQDDADHAMEVARAVISDVGNTSGDTLDDLKPLAEVVRSNTPPREETKTEQPISDRPQNKRADANTGPSAAWKRSLPSSLTPSNLQIDKNERRGPEPVHRGESLHSKSHSGELADSSGNGGDAGIVSLLSMTEDGGKAKPLSSIRPAPAKRAASSSLTQLAPIVPPALNVDPLAAKAILGSIRRGINPSKEANIISTLNIVDNQMAMAGIGIHSRAALFISLLDDSAQHAILNRSELANNWEALRKHLVETRSNKSIRSDVMEDFIQCARSVTPGGAEACARVAVEQLELMQPSTNAKLGIPTFIASVPDDALRADFHELYEMTLSAMDAESDDENAYIVAFVEAAKLIDRRKNGRMSTGGADRPKRGHRRDGSLSSMNSEGSRRNHQRSQSQSMHSRNGSTSFRSSNGTTPRLKKSSTRVYDRLTGEERVVEREVPVMKDHYADDNESIVSGRSGKSRQSMGRMSTFSGAYDTEAKNNKCIVTVYNYPKDLSLAQLIEMTTPPAGRAPVMIRHKDGLIKVLFSNSIAAQEITQMLNNCTVNGVVLGANCEVRGQGGGEGTTPPPLARGVSTRSQMSPTRQPSFAAGRPPAGDPNNGPPPPPLQPVFPEKEDITQLWDHETNLFVGTVSLILSAAMSGLGNGFEINSPLAYMHIFFLLCGFEFFNRGMDHAWHGFILGMGFVIITQSLGSLLGFAYFFSTPERNAITVNVTLLFSVILWVAYAFCAVMLEYAYRYKFPDASSVPFVFPAAHTMVTTVMFGTRFGTYFALGNAVTDYEPMRQVAAAFGIGGIHFLAVLIPTLFFLKFIRHEFKPPTRNTVGYYFVAVLIILSAMAFVREGDYLYQRGVKIAGHHSTLPVSCISGREYTTGSDRWDQVMASSRARLVAGDTFVMWADRTLSVSSDTDEAALLLEVQDLVISVGANASYVGVAYERIENSNKVHNMFYLIGPDGVIVMEHEKTLPIPFVDDNVVESSSKDFVSADIPGVGKVGVGMGFELSNPSYMRQAGEDGVDIVLQPVWSHGGIGRRRFDSDSIRAIENGFTLFRCDSNGVSGVVGPRGDILSKAFVLIDPEEPSTFNLPVRQGISTFYTAVGFSFDYICTAFTCLFWLLVLTPWYFLDKISGACTKKEEKPINFVITRNQDGQDEFAMIDRPPVSSGNPYAGVTETLQNTPDSEEDAEVDYGGYYSGGQQTNSGEFGDEV